GTDVARTNKRSAEVNAAQDARLAYFEWVRVKFQVLIAQRQVLQVQTTLKQVRALAEVQRLSKADLLRVESQEAEAERTADILSKLAVLREEQLRLLMGASEQPLTIGEDIRREVSPPAEANLDELMKHAVVRRLDVKTVDLGIEAKDKQRDAEKAN